MKLPKGTEVWIGRKKFTKEIPDELAKNIKMPPEKKKKNTAQNDAANSKKEGK